MSGNRVYVISVPWVQIPFSAPKKHLFKVLFLVFYGSMRNFSYSLLRNCVLVCVYIPSVTFMSLCPARLWQTLTLIPHSAQRVTKVCRKSCSLCVGQNRLNVLLTIHCLYGNTSRLSGHCAFCLWSSSRTCGSISRRRNDESVFVPRIRIVPLSKSTSDQRKARASQRRTPV